MKLKGIVVPLGTPVDDQERVDERGLRRLVRYVVDQGVHGLMVNGSMGGFALRSDDEQLRTLDIVLDEVAGCVPVVANVGETGTRRALAKARNFAALGPAYLSILPPYYFLLSQSDLRNYYRELADALQLPILLYNNPVLTKTDIELATILELSEHPNIVGIKDSKQDFDKWLRLVRAFRANGFSVLAGTEFLVAVALAAGCDGVVGGLHNVCPQLAVEIYNAVATGELARADELQDRLNAVFAIFEGPNLWGAFEVALEHLGICRKITAAPYRSVSDPAERQRVIAVLEQNLEVARLTSLGNRASK